MIPNTIIDGVNVRHRSLSDMAAALEYIETLEVVPGGGLRTKSGDVPVNFPEGHRMKRRRGSVASLREGRDWSGTRTVAEYLDIAKNGWFEIVDETEGLEGLSSDSMERVQFTRDVGGAFPIVPAHLSGHPNSMLRPAMQDAETERGLTLVINGSVSAAVSAQQIKEHAQACMRLVAWLQAERIQTAVYSVYASKMIGNTEVYYIIPILPSGYVLQPERIAAAMHPATFRRGLFACKEQDLYRYDLPGAESTLEGYGIALEPKLDVLTKAIPEAYSIVLLPKAGRYSSEAAIRKAVNLKLKRKD